MADHPVISPGEEIHTYIEELFHPVVTDFRIWRGEALRGRFWRKNAVHLQNSRKIFGTAETYFKREPRFVGFDNALIRLKNHDRLLKVKSFLSIPSAIAEITRNCC